MLTFKKARNAGYDATDTQERRIQVKSRVIPNGKSLGGQRLGWISLKHEWDVVLAVLMDELFELKAVYSADRHDIQDSLAGEKRNDLHVTKFISIGHQVWPPSET